MPLAPRKTRTTFKHASDPAAAIGSMRIIGANIDQNGKGYVRVMKPSVSFLSALGKPTDQDVAIGSYYVDDLIAAEHRWIQSQAADAGLGTSMYNNLKIDRGRAGTVVPETTLTDFIAHCITLINAKGDQLGKPQPRK